MPPGALICHHPVERIGLASLLSLLMISISGAPPSYLMRPPLMMQPPPAGPVVLTPPGIFAVHKLHLRRQLGDTTVTMLAMSQAVY